MISLPSLSQLDRASSTRIWLCTGPTDMRRGFDRLAEQARIVTRQDPLSGHLFLFRSRRGDRMKALYFDRDGYVLWYKRLCLHTAAPSVSSECLNGFAVLMAVARSASRSHRLQCLTGGSGPGASYRYACPA